MILTLCDTGPLLAIIDPRQEPQHSRCVGELKMLRGKLRTTWPCIAEGMHLADNLGGRPMEQALWKLLADDVFEVAEQVKRQGDRMDQLMERYGNVPMDFADASLFVEAEQTECRRIFTLDNDFRIYRFDDGGFFEVVPD